MVFNSSEEVRVIIDCWFNKVLRENIHVCISSPGFIWTSGFNGCPDLLENDREIVEPSA